MRLKEVFWTLGFKPKTKTYGTKREGYTLEKDGRLEIAQWLHPKAGSYVPSQKEVDELRKFLKPGDACIDVGAYIGDTAIPMALAVGKEGLVFALEPNRYVFKVLEENTKLNTHRTNIIPLNFAATPEDSEMEFEYSDPGYCNGGFHENMSVWSHGHAFKLKVQGRNTYRYLQQNYPDDIARIRYIKVDAEGFDLSVLQSLEELVSRNLPYLRVEVFKQSSLSYRQKLYAFLKKYNYSTYLFGGIDNYQAQAIAEAELMNWKHYDIFAVPPSK